MFFHVNFIFSYVQCSLIVISLWNAYLNSLVNFLAKIIYSWLFDHYNIASFFSLRASSLYKFFTTNFFSHEIYMIDVSRFNVSRCIIFFSMILPFHEFLKIKPYLNPRAYICSSNLYFIYFCTLKKKSSLMCHELFLE